MAGRVSRLISHGFIGTMVLLVGVSMLVDALRELNGLDRFDGVIAAKGITQHSSRTAGGGASTSDVFYLRLDGLNQTLAVFDRSNDYAQLEENIRVGDRIRVFYKSSPDPDKLNLDTYQIEKGDDVILGQQKQRNKLLFAGGIATVFGIFVVFLFFMDLRSPE